MARRTHVWSSAIGLALAVLTLAAPAPAATGRDVGHRLDAALDQARAQVGDPGVQAVAMRNGRVVWSATRGTAILDPEQPVRRRTMFCFGSFGKLMLTAYALNRVEAGALELDRPIEAYVGDDVAGSDVITPRMLLTHTAGYPDLYSAPETAPLFGELYDPNREWSFELLATGIHDPVDPAARWEYSNTGFIVLAHVLQAITPGPLEDAYMRFAARAGLSEERITMRRSRQALRRFAHGYILRDNVLRDSFEGAAGIPTDMYGMPFGDGAFAGTARGAAQLLDGLFARGRLLRPATVREMTEPTPQALAAGVTYGMGTEREVVAERTWQGHGGTYGGFTTMAATDRERGVSIAVVTNRELPDQHPGTVVWRALAEAYAQGDR